MKVVVSDLEAGALDAAVEELRRQGRDVVGVLADVARPQAVEELAARRSTPTDRGSTSSATPRA
jgi:hypothetical protein